MKISKLSFRPLLIAIALVAALVLAACGDDDDSGSADLGADPATLVPADAPVFLEAVVKPEGELGEDADSALGKLLGSDDPGAMITDAIDAELSSEDAGVSWEEIDSWLGSRVGGFLTAVGPDSAEGAAIVAVTDTGAAQETLDKLEASGDGELTDATYEDVTYRVNAKEDSAYGFVDDEFLVLGTEQGFKDAVDAGGADALADDATATEALESAGEGGLFSALVDAPELVDQLIESGAVREQDLGPYEQQLAQLGDEPVVFSAGVEPDAFTVQSSAAATEDAPATTEIVSTLPADAWFAFGAADLGEMLELSLDSALGSFEAGAAGQYPGVEIPDIRKEIEKQTGFDLEQDLDWIGDVGGFVQGSSIFGLGGGLVIETDDEQAASDSLDSLAKALGRQGVDVSETPDGYQLQVQGAPIGAELAIRDGKVVLAAAGASVDDVLSPAETLDSSERFGTAAEALGEDLTPALFVDMPTIVELIESTGQATADPDYQAARQYLAAIDYIVAGSSAEGERMISKFVLGVREAPSESGAAATLIP